MADFWLGYSSVEDQYAKRFAEKKNTLFDFLMFWNAVKVFRNCAKHRKPIWGNQCYCNFSWKIQKPRKGNRNLLFCIFHFSDSDDCLLKFKHTKSEIVESWKKTRANLENDAKMHQDVAAQLKDEIVGNIASFINETESKMVCSFFFLLLRKI